MQKYSDGFSFCLREVWVSWPVVRISWKYLFETKIYRLVAASSINESAWKMYRRNISAPKTSKQMMGID